MNTIIDATHILAVMLYMTFVYVLFMPILLAFTAVGMVKGFIRQGTKGVQEEINDTFAEEMAMPDNSATKRNIMHVIAGLAVPAALLLFLL